MQQYLDYLRHIRNNGHWKADRTGTGTYSVFGYQMRFDLKRGRIPMVTTKKLHLKSVLHELLWFLKGDTNISYLQDNGVTIWDEWASPEDVFEEVELSMDEKANLLAKNFNTHVDVAMVQLLAKGTNAAINSYMTVYGLPTTKTVQKAVKGDIGPGYGYQWRSWPTPDGKHIDQISQLIADLKKNPDNRRLIVSAWNVADIPRMNLPACHCFFQFWSRELTGNEIKSIHRIDFPEVYDFDGDPDVPRDVGIRRYAESKGWPTRALSCQLYQRSCDSFLGVPFNILSYALLTRMVAHVCNMEADEFIWTGGDCHIYSDHVNKVDLQLSREPFESPTLHLNPEVLDIFDFKFEDFTIENYQHHPAIKAPVAV